MSDKIKAQETARLVSDADAIDRQFGTASAPPAGEPGEAAPPAAAGDAAQPAALTTAQELTALLVIVRGLLAPMLPSLATIYSDKNIAEIARNTAPVIDKHGWQRFIKLAAWQEEIICASTLIPIATVTYQGVKRDIEALKKAKAEHEAKTKKKPDTPPAAPAAGTVSDGDAAGES